MKNALRKFVSVLLAMLMLTGALQTFAVQATYSASAQTLPAPTGLKYEGDRIVSWNAVAGAQWYFVLVNGSIERLASWEEEGVTKFDLWGVMFNIRDTSPPGNPIQLQIQVMSAIGDIAWDPDTTSEYSAPITVSIPRVPSPSIYLDADGFTLRWNRPPELSYVIEYGFYAGGEQVGSTWGDITSYDLRELRLEPGVHTIQVVIVDWGRFMLSSMSNTVAYSPQGLPTLPAPTGLSTSNNVLTWNAVAGAVWYGIEIFNANGDSVYYDTTRYWDQPNRTRFDLRFVGWLGVGETYHVRVRAYGDWVNNSNSVLSASASFVPDGTQPPKMNTPVNLRIEGTTLSWDAVPGAQRYEVNTIGDFNDWTEDVTYDLVRFAEFPGVHQIRIRAYGEDGAYEASDYSQPVTYVQGSLPIPTGFKYDGNGFISWDAVAGAKWYMIRLNDLDLWWVSDEEGVTTYDLREFLLNIQDTSPPGTPIQIQVQVRAARGENQWTVDMYSEYSNPIAIDIPRLPSPSIYLDANGFTLRWNDLPGIKEYNFFADGMQVHSIRDWESNQYDLRELRLASGAHTIQLVALDWDGFGMSALSNTVTYTQQNLPYLPTPTGLSINGGILTWNAATGANVYDIMVFDVNGESVESISAYTRSFNMLLFENLEVGETYQVRVRAIGDWISFFDSEYSAPVSYAPDGTQPPQLDKPTNVKIEGTVLTWDEVTNAVYYILHVDGEYVTWIVDKTFDLAVLQLPPGEYQIQMQAFGDWGVIKESELSDPVTFVVNDGPDTPSDPRFAAAGVNGPDNEYVNFEDPLVYSTWLNASAYRANAIEVTFTVNDNLDLTSVYIGPELLALGFDLVGDIVWNDILDSDGNVTAIQGRATLGIKRDLADLDGLYDMLGLNFDAIRATAVWDAPEEAKITLTRVVIVIHPPGVPAERIVAYIAPDDSTRKAFVYSKYDLNKDGIVDVVDLGIALLVIGWSSDQVGWDDFVVSYDANGKAITPAMINVNTVAIDGKQMINMLDALDIMRNYTEW